MSDGIAREHCIPCEGGTPAFPAAEAAALHSGLGDGWQLGDLSIHLEMKFRDFAGAFAFATRLALLAEAEGHHPDLEIGWGKCGVTLTTHTAGGLTRNDFVMAAKIDRLR